MDDYDENEDEFFDEGIALLEARRSLERIRADGARVEVDATEDTSLRRYVNSRRAEAMIAMEGLVVVEPEDALSVAKLQHIVSEYLNVRAWIRGEIEQSRQADEAIQRDYRGEITIND